MLRTELMIAMACVTFIACVSGSKTQDEVGKKRDEGPQEEHALFSAGDGSIYSGPLSAAPPPELDLPDLQLDENGNPLVILSVRAPYKDGDVTPFAFRAQAGTGAKAAYQEKSGLVVRGYDAAGVEIAVTAFAAISAAPKLNRLNGVNAVFPVPNEEDIVRYVATCVLWYELTESSGKKLIQPIMARASFEGPAASDALRGPRHGLSDSFTAAWDGNDQLVITNLNSYRKTVKDEFLSDSAGLKSVVVVTGKKGTTEVVKHYALDGALFNGGIGAKHLVGDKNGIKTGINKGDFDADSIVRVTVSVWCQSALGSPPSKKTDLQLIVRIVPLMA